MTLYDAPIESISQDLFDRAEMARNCADTLTRIRSNQSYVVGLSGPWGSGKTSFLTLVKEVLSDRVDTPVVVDFDAWLYSSQEQLIRQFFAEVKRAIGNSAVDRIGTKATHEIGAALAEYSETITESGADLIGKAIALAMQQTALWKGLPFVSSAGKHILKRTIADAGDALKREKTVVELRADLIDRLSKLDRNILVLIDNIDRLPKEDICAIFKLVNLTASFPRMTFLLSYDSSVVTDALAGIQGVDGRAYLEKIMQLPLMLPHPPAGILRKQLVDALTPHIESDTVLFTDDEEQSRRIEIFDSFVAELTMTPRQVKRYLNAFEAIAPALEGEICLADIVGLVGLHLYMPHSLDWLWSHREDVCDTRYSTLWADDAKADTLRPSLEAAIVQDGIDPERTIRSFCLLFPRMVKWFQENPYYSTRIGRETGRVADIHNFELFMVLSTGADVKRAELHHLTYEVGQSELLYQIKKLDLQGQLPRLVEFIGLNLGNIAQDRKREIAAALLTVIGGIDRSDSDQAFTRAVIDQVTKLIENLLLDIGMTEADQLVTQCVKDYEAIDFAGLTWFLRDETLARSDEGTKLPCISEDVYESVARAYIREIVNSYPKVLRTPGKPAHIFWRRLDEKLDNTALAEIRERYSNDARVVVLCAAASLAHWHSSGGSGFECDPSIHQGYEPVFPAPDISDIEVFGHSEAYPSLPEEIKVRVASLYLLASEDGTDGAVINDNQVNYNTALTLVKKWEREIAEQTLGNCMGHHPTDRPQ